MNKKIGFIGAVLASAIISFAVFAPTASAAPPTPGVALAGRGFLAAHGTGVAAVRGKMAYEATAGEGILLVQDYAGDANVNVTGHGQTGEWLGFKVYFGFSGHATITGSDVGVILVGHDVDLRVFGKGWAYLKGRGLYRVNAGSLHGWNDDGVFAGFEPEPAPSAP